MNMFFELVSPKQAIQFYYSILTEFTEPQSFYKKYYDKIINKIKIIGRGFPPIAVTLGGLMSIAGTIVSYIVFRDYLKYIITSPEVDEGRGIFELSHRYYEVFVDKIGLEPIIVPFNNIPMYVDAEILLNVMKEGAIILQGVSAEIAVWFGRNAGIGRLIIYRPENGVGVFRYV